MKTCCYICKCISKENGCVQNSSLQILTFHRIELLSLLYAFIFHKCEIWIAYLLSKNYFDFEKNKSIEISCCHIQENEMLTRILTKRTVLKFDVNFVFGV